VECFRGLRGVRLQLAPLTLLTGRNNSGKSSLLEALSLAFSSPGLRDWLGRDIPRSVVDDKLAGVPARLISTACSQGVAHIRLQHGDTSAGTCITRLDDSIIGEVAVLILSRLVSRLWRELLEGGEARRCLEEALSRGTDRGQASALATMLLTTGYVIAAAAAEGKTAYAIKKLMDEALVPHSVIEALQYETQRILGTLASKNRYIKAGMRVLVGLAAGGAAVVEVGGRLCIYLPGRVRRDAWRRLGNELSHLGEKVRGLDPPGGGQGSQGSRPPRPIRRLYSAAA